MSMKSLIDRQERLERENTELREVVLLLMEENKRLRGIIAKNSSNSSKPPSSDGPSKAKPKNLRQKTDRKPGGQPGHGGKTLRQVASPDKREFHPPEACSCGRHLEDAEVVGVATRQVFDIPPIEIKVVEHVVETRRCPDCGTLVSGDFPGSVRAPAQYGPRVKALGAYLTDYQFVPYARTAEFMRDVLGANVSEGFVSGLRRKLSKVAAPSALAAREAVLAAKVVGFDETGLRSSCGKKWLHAASSPSAVFYAASKGRGSDAMREIGLLDVFKGIALHDHWSAYYKFTLSHAECCAHILRGLKFLKEEMGVDWAERMASLLVEAKEEKERTLYLGLSSLAPEIEEAIDTAYDRIVAEALDRHPPPKPNGKRGRPARSEAGNMAERLRTFKNETLAFVRDFDVPFDNNMAERDIRMMKLKQKISGTFRGAESPDAWCVVRTYIATARRRGLSAFQAILDAFEDRPFIPA